MIENLIIFGLGYALAVIVHKTDWISALWTRITNG